VNQNYNNHVNQNDESIVNQNYNNHVSQNYNNHVNKKEGKHVNQNEENLLQDFSAVHVETLSSKRIAYVYHCDNETVEGTETPHSAAVPEMYGGDVVHVADMSSNFLTRPVDISRYGLVFATAQKNFGPAGVTVVLIRKALLESLARTESQPPAGDQKRPPACPLMMSYEVGARHGSLYNTPPTFAILVCNLTMRWMQGSLEHWDRLSRRKSGLLYDAIGRHRGLFFGTADERCRSRMNVTFRVGPCGVPDAELEERFIGEAADTHSITGIRGHRSVGGIRVSLYNAVTLDEVRVLVAFMDAFARIHASPPAH
jgi:phosphoserine aminotransferase